MYLQYISDNILRGFVDISKCLNYSFFIEEIKKFIRLYRFLHIHFCGIYSIIKYS